MVNEPSSPSNGAGRKPADDPLPVLALLVRLRAQVRRLVRGERALLRLEVSRRRSQATTGIGLLVGTALLAFFGVACLVVLLGVALSGALPLWLATLLVAVLLLLPAGGLGLLAMRTLKARASSTTGVLVSEARDEAR